MSEQPSLRLGLRENAYHFLEESLTYAEDHIDNAIGLKFAVISAAQGIELLLKARLAMEHPLLIRANIDGASRNTVTAEVALSRLKKADVSFDAEDERRLERARRLRNEFMHYEVNASVDQMRSAHADLFEFAQVFHLAAFDEELHDWLGTHVHPAEAMVMEQFRREFVTYQGAEIIKSFPSEIIEAQFARTIRFGTESLDRIPCGDDRDLLSPAKNCHDCGVLGGQLHAFNCDAERCPKCAGQLLSCECDGEFVWADDDFNPYASI